MVRKWLTGSFLTTFTHPFRDCLYDEATFCLKVPRGEIYRKELAQQTAAYQRAGMPRHWGLAETRCVMRVNSPQITKMNELWWSEIQAHSPRDQVSLPYVCWKLGIKWGELPGRIRIFNSPGGATGPFFCIKHGHDL